MPLNSGSHTAWRRVAMNSGHWTCVDYAKKEENKVSAT